MPLKVVFMGTPDFAVPTLAEIVGGGHEVVAVYTRAPAPAGRGMSLRPSPVQALAEKFGLPVLTPRTLRTDEAAETFRGHGADVAVVVAYGMILPPAILDAPALGCLNLHASLLPRWRGAAPIQRAVMAGDEETGVAVMRMEPGLDTGPVGMVERVAITPDMTAGELHDRLMPLGADLMARALGALERGNLQFRAQAAEGVVTAHTNPTAAARREGAHPAPPPHDRVRGLSPFPGAYVTADLGRGPERVKVLRARLAQRSLAQGSGEPGTLLDAAGTVAAGEGALRLVTVQPAGKGAMAFEDFARGRQLAPGARLA